MREAYARTIKFLADEFGEKPPPDIWPVSGIGEPTTLLTLDASRYYAVPKPEAKFGTVSVLVLATATSAWALGALHAAEAVFFGFGGLLVSAMFLLPIARNKKEEGGCSGSGDGGGCGGGD